MTKLNFKKIQKIMLGFLISFLPLAVFDLRNNFLNLRLMMNILQSTGGRDITSFLPVWDNVVSKFFGINNSSIISIAFYLAVLTLLLRFKKNYIWRPFLITWIMFPIVFALWGMRPSEYYFTAVVVVAVLAISKFFESAKTPLLIFGAIVLLAMGIKSLEQLNDNSLGLNKKDSAIKFLAEITKNTHPFNLSFSMGAEGDVGLRYLLKYRDVNYSQDQNDPLIQLSHPPTAGATFIKSGIGISLPADWLEDNWVK